ncbi:hypothetical protein B0H19DRAFT_1196880 [Mycena capillaripes]|nr:hypothetical protein B0H19DRAFT_1196880 [Mycena capillaripes]
MGTVSEAQIAELYAVLQSQAYAASAALFFNAICLLLFAFAVLSLVKMKTRASRVFLCLAVILVLFALSQAFLDVALAVIFSRMVENLLVSGSKTEVLSLEQNWVHIGLASQALLAINNAITDSLLLYRCALIWGSSHYTKVVIAIPSVLILSTLVVGFYGTFAIATNFWVPYALALFTNFVLLALTAGRIWRKGRQATVVLGIEAGQKYNKTLEIICESSLLYFVNVFIYMIATTTQPFTAPLPNLAWGSMGQVVNIVPMMIMVRVGMRRNSGEQEPEGRIFYGGNAGRYGMTPVSDVTTPLKGGGKYSQI